jgi:hypothetical protein
VDVNLRIGVGHVPKMPLLTELENLFSFASTKISRLRRSNLDNTQVTKSTGRIDSRKASG